MNLIVSLVLLCTSFGSVSGNPSFVNSGDSLIRKDSGRIVLTKASLNRFNLEDSLQNLYNEIGLNDYNLSFEVFRYGMVGYYSLKEQGKLNDKNLLTIIDFTKSSNEKRFYTIDLNAHKLKYYTYTSHGKNTGDVNASQFSNRVNSNQSSMGFYVTGETYIGSKGFSLKLDGQDGSYNDKMRERGVVIHSADYVSEIWIKKYGRLGRSFGCPALSKELYREIIESIKNHTVVFGYFNDQQYLNASQYLNTEVLFQKWETEIQPNESIASMMPD